MSQPGWMDGFSPHDLPKPLDWQKGQTTLSIPVVCCPECSSIQVRPKDNGKNETVEWWECGMCRHRFRIPFIPHIRAWLRS